MPRSFQLIVLLFFLPSLIFAQNIAFNQRDTWDGPYDIKMISGINLQPVFLNSVEAERGGTSRGYLLADSVITNGTMQRTGDLFEINNRYKDGSSNSVFEQYDIPLPAILCQGNPNMSGCLQGLQPSTNNSSCPSPATRYNSSPDEVEDVYVSMSYSDYDTDMSTFSSSMAALNISSCSEIESAYLYWTGNFSGGSNKPIELVPGPLNSYSGSRDVFNTSNSSVNYDEIKFKIPGGAYQNVTAISRHTSATTYVCVADVTSMLSGLQGGGEFWAANIRSFPIEENGGSTSGWTLVVVFRSPLSPPRLINLWDGFKNIGSGGEEIFNLTGLQAPATSNFRSYVGFAALDGENLATQLDGDTPEGLGFKTNNGGVPFNINPFQTDQPSYKLYTKKGYPATCSGGDNTESSCRVPVFDANWCSVYDGMSSSHITSYDEITELNGNEITRIPNNINTLGYDAHHMILPEGAVSPGANEATLTVRAGPQGSTLPFLAYIAIERLQPKLSMAKTANKDATGLSSQIKYSLKIKNEGNAPSLGGDVIYDTLDAATMFTSGSLTASETGVSVVSTVNNQLEISIGNPIPAGDSVIIDFLVEVIPFAVNPSLFNPPSCKRTIENTAFIEYNTVGSGILQTKSNSNDCGVGTETRVVLVDEQLTSSNTTPLGPFDGCSLETEDVYEKIRTELLNNGMAESMLNQFDIRDSNYVRIRPGDLFGEIVDTKVYYAIQDVSSGASCQEIYELTFECSECSVSVTSSPNASVCSGSPLSYTITADVPTTSFSWNRNVVTGITNSSVSNQTTNPINETLVNTTNDSIKVKYEITPLVANCVSVPFELEVSVIPIAEITNVEVLDSICSGETSTGFLITSNVTNATFSWQSTPMNVTGVTPSGITDSIPSEELIAANGGEVTYSVTPSLDGLCVGTAVDFTVVVSSNPLVSANSDAIDNKTCPGDAVILSGNGAGVDADYSWSDGVVDGVAFVPTTDKRYFLNGSNQSGCFDTTSIEIKVNDKPLATISGGKEVCDGGALELTIGLSSGKAPFTVDVLVGSLTLSYNSASLAPQDSVTFIANLAGAYSLFNLKDANGCTALATDLITETSVVYIDVPVAEITNPTTRSKTISNTTNHYQLESAVIPSGYTGEWSNTGMGTISQSGYLSSLNNTVETDGLSAATSIVIWEVNDLGNVCPSATDTVNIIRREITVAEAVNDTICLSTSTYVQQPITLPNSSIGEQAEWLAVGGTPAPLPGSTTLEVDFTERATYQYTYRIFNPTLFDDLGNPLQSQKTITIVVNDIPDVSLANLSGVDFGCLDSAKIYKAVGVTNVETYQWILPLGFSGSSVVDSIDVKLGSILGGTIEVFASNETCGINPLPLSISVTDIRQVPQIKPVIDGVDEVCESQSTTVYTITNDLADAKYVTWKWNTNIKLNLVDPSRDLILNAVDFTGLTSGIIEAIPVNECGANELVKGQLSIAILNEIKPEVSLSSNKLNDEFCLADNNPVNFIALPIKGFGNNPTFEFVINGTGERSPISPTNIYEAADIQDIVTVIMTSNDGCRSQDTAMAIVRMKDISPSISLSLGADKCAGEKVVIKALISPKDRNGSSLQWYNHNQELMNMQNQPQVVFSNSGFYSLYSVYDNGVCEPVSSIQDPMDSVQFTIWDQPVIVLPPSIQRGIYQVTTNKQHETVFTLPITVAGLLNDTVMYDWQGEGILNGGAHDLTISYLPNQEGVYEYELTVSNVNFLQCQDRKQFEIRANIALEVPNAFSPNGDGVNDWWEIPGITRYQNARVQIYNRWGNQLFDKSGYNSSNAWRGDGYPVGTYYYVIQLNSEAWPEPLTGALTITR